MLVRPLQGPLVPLGSSGLPWDAGGGRPASLPALSYITGFTAATNYADGAGVAGSDAHTFYVALIHRASTVGAVIAGKLTTVATTPTTAGWSFSKSSAGVVAFNMRDGVGVKTTPTTTLGAGDVGDVMLLHGVVDVANNIVRLYKQGAQVGAGTATSGSFVASVNTMGVGSRNAGGVSVAGDADIVAFGAVDVVMSDAEIAAHYAAAVAAQKVSIPAVAYTVGNNWSAEDYAASWVAEIGGSALATTGTLSTGTIASPTWA